jgi:hypothetical protein
MAKENIPHDEVFFVHYPLVVTPSMEGSYVAVTNLRVQ